MGNHRDRPQPVSVHAFRRHRDYLPTQSQGSLPISPIVPPSRSSGRALIKNNLASPSRLLFNQRLDGMPVNANEISPPFLSCIANNFGKMEARAEGHFAYTCQFSNFGYTPGPEVDSYLWTYCYNGSQRAQVYSKIDLGMFQPPPVPAEPSPNRTSLLFSNVISNGDESARKYRT
jgi:hypothetical protein